MLSCGKSFLSYGELLIHWFRRSAAPEARKGSRLEDFFSYGLIMIHKQRNPKGSGPARKKKARISREINSILLRISYLWCGVVVVVSTWWHVGVLSTFVVCVSNISSRAPSSKASDHECQTRSKTELIQKMPGARGPGHQMTSYDVGRRPTTNDDERRRTTYDVVRRAEESL